MLAVEIPDGDASQVPETEEIGRVDGRPWSMLAAEGRLFVVTAEGHLHGFAGEEGSATVHVEPVARFGPLQGSRPPVDGRQALEDEPRPATRLIAYRGSDGERLWEKDFSYRNACLIHGDKILSQDETPRRYTVRLHFVEPTNAAAGERSFDVLLQGERVLEGLDPAAEAGASREGIVRQFEGVEATGRLRVELRAAPDSSRPPLLCGVEAIEEEAAGE